MLRDTSHMVRIVEIVLFWLQGDEARMLEQRLSGQVRTLSGGEVLPDEEPLVLEGLLTVSMDPGRPCISA